MSSIKRIEEIVFQNVRGASLLKLTFATIQYCFREGLVQIPASDITVMVLGNPNQPTECNDQTKQDFETIMADPVSGDIYLPQKQRFLSETDVTLYKVFKFPI